MARTADLVLMMLDATKGEVQRALLEKELESVGIRLNRKKPNIYFKVVRNLRVFNQNTILNGRYFHFLGAAEKRWRVGF